MNVKVVKKTIEFIQIIFVFESRGLSIFDKILKLKNALFHKSTNDTSHGSEANIAQIVSKSLFFTIYNCDLFTLFR